MAAFRLLDQKPAYTTALGALAAGGTISFYTSGTSTPKAVYSGPDLGTSLGSTIDLDADGRHSEDIWLDDSVSAYRVDVKDSDGVSIPGYPIDNVQFADTAGIAPPDPTGGSDGQGLFTTGTEWYFDDVLTIPSQTGNSGKFLTTDGEALSWGVIDLPDIPDDGVTQPSATVLTAGAVMMQVGTGTCPTSGSETSSVAITFGTAFGAGTVYVVCSCNAGSAVTADGARAFVNVSGNPSTTGFTAVAAAQDEHDGAATNLSSTVAFTWFAWGPAP